MFKAILWDNDGVLVDTEWLFFQVTKTAFKQLGVDLTKDTWVSLYLEKGFSSRQIVTHLGGNTQSIEQVLVERNLKYNAVLQDPPPIRPTVHQTLRTLKGQFKMGIVTGASRDQLNLMHRTTGLLEFFDFTVTSEDYNRSKPDPEPYFNAVKFLDINPDECLAIEDSARGLAAAIAAGLKCIIVPTKLTNNQDYNDAYGVVENAFGVLMYLNSKDE